LDERAKYSLSLLFILPNGVLSFFYPSNRTHELVRLLLLFSVRTFLSEMGSGIYPRSSLYFDGAHTHSFLSKSKNQTTSYILKSTPTSCDSEKCFAVYIAGKGWFPPFFMVHFLSSSKSVLILLSSPLTEFAVPRYMGQTTLICLKH